MSWVPFDGLIHFVPEETEAPEQDGGMGSLEGRGYK